MHEEERMRPDDHAKDALEFLLLMTRCYLVQDGSPRDLDVRSRIIVNGILSALDREDLRFARAPKLGCNQRHH